MNENLYAVAAQRKSSKEGLDYFPTPPWATRALMEYVMPRMYNKKWIEKSSCLEPACGEGHMSKVLKEYFGGVYSSDIHNYGYETQYVKDFFEIDHITNQFNWMITNPPFNKAEEFVTKGLTLATFVAILVRTQFIEGIGRYNRLFKNNPPRFVAQFSERVPMLQGRLDRKGSTATSYAWLVFCRNGIQNTELMWIPPCRKQLEKDEDYE